MAGTSPAMTKEKVRRAKNATRKKKGREWRDLGGERKEKS
jgi:hypothetical protein